MFACLLPKSAPYFELLLRQNELLRTVSKNLATILTSPGEKDASLKQIALLEEEADRIFSKITWHLSQTFITPIDREDILRINQNQEEAIDFFQNLATRMHIYEFGRIRFPAVQLVKNLAAMVDMTHDMLVGLSRKKDCHNTRAFRNLRGECEMLLSVGIAEIQDLPELSPASVLDIIKWGQAYDRIEMTVAQMVKLAEIIEEAVLKNA